MHFADRLIAAVRDRRTPVLVGLDPRTEWLPGPLQPKDSSPSAVAASYLEFCRDVIDAVAPVVPAVKPQAAFFEELGAAGVAALAETIAYARRQGLLVILDAKRGDIGSTAQAYARGLLGAGDWGQGSEVRDQRSEVRGQRLEVGGQRSDAGRGSESAGSLAADAVTVNPYLGGDSLEPFVDIAAERESGVFVLVKTSNPGGGMFQDLVAEGRPVYRHVADYVERLAEKTRGPSGYGAVGAVVGATYPAQLAELRSAMPSALFLVPGYGSQGGAAADVAAALDERGLGAVINNSRGIIFAHRRADYARFGEHAWQDAVEAAAKDMIAALRAQTTAGRL
jgi:orotidine-5'-phosphate decarboxylase